MRKTFDIGDRVSLSATFKNADTDALVDPTTVVLTVEKPNGTTVNPTVSHPSTGLYTAAVTPATGEHGRWWYAFVGTGDVPARQERFFMVRKQQVP